MLLDMPLSNAQLELMRMFNHDLSDDDLLELKNILANFFAKRATAEMDRLWVENGWTNETMDEWLKGEDESEG